MAKPSKPHPSTVLQCLSDSNRVELVALDRTRGMLDEMLTLYYPPFRAESEEELLDQTLVALRRYVIELGCYDRDTIDRAWGEVVSRHKTERWPTVGEIAEECRARDPQARTASATLPGERKGYDPKRFPPKARPDFTYAIEQGLMTEEQAKRRMAKYDARTE